jgi:hypothetical protein
MFGLIGWERLLDSGEGFLLGGRNGERFFLGGQRLLLLRCGFVRDGRDGLFRGGIGDGSFADWCCGGFLGKSWWEGFLGADGLDDHDG